MAPRPPQEQSHKTFAIVLTIIALVGGALTWGATLAHNDPLEDCGNRFVTQAARADC